MSEALRMLWSDQSAHYDLRQPSAADAQLADIYDVSTRSKMSFLEACQSLAVDRRGSFVRADKPSVMLDTYYNRLRIRSTEEKRDLAITMDDTLAQWVEI